MDQVIIQAALKERDRLLAELQKTPVYARYVAISELLKTYGEDRPAKPTLMAKSDKKNEPRAKTGPKGKRRSKGQGLKGAIEQAVLLFMAENDGVSSHEILNFIKLKGIAVSENTFRAYLSRVKGIFYEKKKGWQLKKPKSQPHLPHVSDSNDTATRA